MLLVLCLLMYKEFLRESATFFAFFLPGAMWMSGTFQSENKLSLFFSFLNYHSETLCNRSFT